MHTDSIIILNQRKRIEKFEKTVEELTIKNKALRLELVESKKARQFRKLALKANKYDALLKEYQRLMVENKLNEVMMEDMRYSVTNLFKT